LDARELPDGKKFIVFPEESGQSLIGAPAHQEHIPLSLGTLHGTLAC
jgi:hypothetical protein